MHSKEVIQLDSLLCDVEVLAERAKVLVEDVQQDYFGQVIKTKNDTYKIMSPYYDHAGIKIDIANDIVFDLRTKLAELREYLDGVQ